MKLIIMTKSTFFVEEDKILSTLFEEGMDNLHLYKPGTEPVYSERLLTLLPEEYRSRITVHDHFYLKDEFHLKGIHIDNAAILPPPGYKGAISRTCHDISELKDMKKKSNYVFLENPFDNESDLIDKRVYALGGITLDSMRKAKDFGYGGIVVCDDLWNRFNIHHETDYKELLNHFEKLRKAVG